MRISAIGDVIKVWVWLLGSVLVGLLLTPLAYNGGKALSELSATKDFNGMVNSLATWSGAAGMEDFFMVCWPLAALASLFPLTEWLSRAGGGGNEPRDTPPRTNEAPDVANLPIMPVRWEPLRMVPGFLMTFSIFTLIGYIAVKAGALRWEADVDAWRSHVLSDLIRALAVAAVVEIFFRCLVQGVFMRAMRASVAIAMAAVMFGVLRFVLSGFGNVDASEGETLSALHLVGSIFGGGNLAERLVIVLLPWFAFACMLGWARWRSGSAWFPAGLIAGWLFAEKLMAEATTTVEIPNRMAGYLTSQPVQDGIVPLIGILAMGGLLRLMGYMNRNHRADACD